MMSDKGNKLDSAQLVTSLIEKSKTGKLNWEPTADRQQFVTSVGGDTSFKIRLITVTDIDDYGQPEKVDLPFLDMLDKEGHLLWQIQGRDVTQQALWDLFQIARRIGNRLDARVAEAIEVLDKL